MLLKQADMPKRLFAAAIGLGAGTFTLTALPGTPSIHNVISAVSLGTDLFAGAWLGLLGGAMMLVGGLWYLERRRLEALASGEGFVPGPHAKLAVPESDTYPHWLYASFPLALVMFCIIVPRLLLPVVGEEAGVISQVLVFANQQPIIWPSIALFIGAVTAALLFSSVRQQTLKVMGDGTQDAIIPLMNTAAVIGFGGVITHTEGFGQFSQWMLGLDLPPLISMFVAVSLASAITGSSSGGLQIFMQTMAPAYLEMGLDVEVLHRLATIASGGFDSLPHCGAIVATLSIMGLSHKEAYRDMGVITVVIPVLTVLVLIGIAI